MASGLVLLAQKASESEPTSLVCSICGQRYDGGWFKRNLPIAETCLIRQNVAFLDVKLLGLKFEEEAPIPCVRKMHWLVVGPRVQD